MKQKFLDPLYGPIAVDDATYSLVFSPEFQRLRYVRLCNINSLFITGASEPKRFEHCLGVYHLADLWARGRALSARDREILLAAALLHDLQTGPFGHSFQYVLEDNPFDQRFEHANLSSGVRARFLQHARAGAAFSGRPFNVAETLADRGEEVFAAVRGEGPFGPLIAGSLDFDNLDNVVRLAFHVGLCDDDDRRLPRALAPMLDVDDGRLALRPGGRVHLERWFGLRRRLYEYLLLDRGEFAAKAMLTLALELAADANIVGPDSWKLTDEELLAELESASVGENQVISQIVRRLRLGDLFECVAVWSSPATEPYQTLSLAEAKREIEGAIEREAAANGASRLRTCVHYILDKKKTCRELRYRDLGDGREKKVGHNSSELLTGVFVTNARAGGIGELDRRRYMQAAADVLGRAGVRDLTIAAEPLAGIHAAQDGLFA